MSSTFTRSGVRRAGDDYQDLVALELLLDMLEHPERFEWVEVEADDAGALDDVVVRRVDGTYLGRQVKFSAHPDAEDDPWTWDALLKQESGKRGPLQSLLQKWAGGYNALRERGVVAQAEIHSNRRAGPDLAAALEPDGCVAWERVQDPATRATIVSQLGSEEAAAAFFGGVRFVLDRPSYDVFEDTLRRRFCGLGGDDHGWLNLKNELRTWVRIRTQPPPDGRITVPVLRSAARWHGLRPLHQGFAVPSDYVPPPDHFHDDFTEAVLGGTSECVVLVGRPGMGKSTYLSWLFAELEKRGNPVIRHHYFLSTKDRSVDRLEHRRVAEALMSELAERYSTALGGLAAENPNPARLRDWLDACGQHFAAAGQRLVVIVDGLDHVWRANRSREELDQLFEHLLPASEGVVVVLGTQPVNDEQLPGRLVRAVPREQWYWLPPLDYGGVVRWVTHHLHILGITETPGFARDRQVQDLATAFYERSSGHPLHLVYTLRALYERGLVASPETIDSLPACAHDDIVGYYRELWQDLPDAGRLILHLIAASRFAWPRAGVLACLDPTGAQRPAYAEGLRRVAHLLDDGPMGLRPIHSSLLAFVADLPDHADYVERMRREALAWLRTAAPPYWRWANEWILTAELGDEEQLLNGPNRAWVVDATVRRYPAEDIDEILGRASVRALQRGDLARFVEVSLLRDYANDGASTREEAMLTLLGPQLLLGEDPHLRPGLHTRLQSLLGPEVATLGLEEARRGDLAAMNRCWEDLLARQSREDPGDDALADQRRDADLEALLQLAPTADPDAKGLVRWAEANRGMSSTPRFLGNYCRAARRARNISPLVALLTADLDASQRAVVLRQAVLLAAEEGIALPEAKLVCDGEVDPLGALLLAVVALNANREPDPVAMRPPSVEVFSERSATARGDDLEAAFYYGFFYCLALRLQGRARDAVDWVGGVVPGHPWIRQALDRLDMAAAAATANLRAGTDISFGGIYEAMVGLGAPSESNDYRSVYELQAGWRRALQDIAFDQMAFEVARGARPRIDRDALCRVVSSPFVRIRAWMDEYVAQGRPYLTDAALDWLFARYDEEARTTVEEFNARAQAIATLAAAAALHGRIADPERYVRVAAEHIIAYLDHKDLLLDGLLDQVRLCHRNDVGEPRHWLLELAPAIAGVRDYTDGDETSHLQSELGAALAEVAPDLLPPYYRWLADQENYHDAEDVFHEFLKTADLADPVALAIAKTATDAVGLGILRERLRSGDDHARAALDVVAEVLGAHVYEEPPSASDQGDAAPQTWTSNNTNREESHPDPAAYAPGRLREYLAAAKAPPYYRRERIGAWLEHWSNAGRASDALEDVEQLIRAGVDVGNGDRLFVLAREVHGRHAAYRWLVRAYRDDWGWNRFATSEKKAEERWAIVARDYPERWFDFLRDTILGPASVPWANISVRMELPRLVRYLVRVGQPVLAAEVSERAVRVTLELVSPAPIGVPGWVARP